MPLPAATSEPVRPPPSTTSQPSLPLPQSSPPSKKRSGSQAFEPYPSDALTRRRDMETEMTGYWIGPMPYEAFVTSFMRSTSSVELPPKFKKTMFKGMSVQRESHIYPELQRKFESIDLFTEYQLVDSSNYPDKNSNIGCKVKIDILEYAPGVDVTKRRAQHDLALLAYELKASKDGDIVDDDASPDKEKASPFERKTDTATLSRGQLATYATEFFARQHRTHCFMVFLCHPYVRFLRWDRSAAIVTRRYDYTTDCTNFVDFLCRFERLTNAEKGLDPTVQIIREPESLIKLVEGKLMPWASPVVERAILKMEVPQRTTDDAFKMRSFYVWHALAEPNSPLGRGTRGYPAVEALPDGLLGSVVFLKDQWRSRNIPPEIETLETLQKMKVRHVPTPVCGGDLDKALKSLGRSNAHQATESTAYVEEAWCIKHPSVRPEIRVHTRLVTAQVGLPLEKFPSTKVLLQVVHDALIGHQDAYTRCDGLLHRDVSASNILILPGLRGLLNDWDMARKVSDMTSGPRDHVRTGTWPFISHRLLMQPGSLHTLDDDIQSFFWVVFHHALRYSKHNFEAPTIAAKIKSIFLYGQYIPLVDQTVGGLEKYALLTNDVRADFMAGYYELEFDSLPLNRFFDEANRLLSDCIDAMRKKGPPLDDPEEDLSQVFLEALRATEWPHDDGAVDIFAPAVKSAVKEDKVDNVFAEIMRRENLEAESAETLKKTITKKP